MEPASSSAAAAASNREPALIEKHVAALRAGSGWVNPECRLPSRFIFSRPPPGLVDSSPLVRKVAMHDVYNRIHRLYTSHQPFFAKDVFRYILEQLDRWRARRFPANHVIFIPALDGSRVKVELETGTVWHHPTAVDSDVACTTYGLPTYLPTYLPIRNTETVGQEDVLIIAAGEIHTWTIEPFNRWPTATRPSSRTWPTARSAWHTRRSTGASPPDDLCLTGGAKSFGRIPCRLTLT